MSRHRKKPPCSADQLTISAASVLALEEDGVLPDEVDNNKLRRRDDSNTPASTPCSGSVEVEGIEADTSTGSYSTTRI